MKKVKYEEKRRGSEGKWGIPLWDGLNQDKWWLWLLESMFKIRLRTKNTQERTHTHGWTKCVYYSKTCNLLQVVERFPYIGIGEGPRGNYKSLQNLRLH